MGLFRCQIVITAACSLLCQSPVDTQPAAAQRARPLLYASVGSKKLEIKAVYSDGRSLGTVATGALLGWSPRGDWFAYCPSNAPNTLHIRNLRSQDAAVFAAPAGDELICGGWQSPWSPSGDTLALVVLKPPPEPPDKNKPTELITPNARAQLGLAPQEPAEPGPAAAYTLQIVDVAQRRVLRTHDVTDSVGGSLLALAWSPDGKRLLFRYWNQTVVINAETGRAELILKRRGTEWSPTGEAVYSQSDIDDRGLPGPSNLVLTPVSGGNPQVIVGKEELDRFAATLELLSVSAKRDRVALGFSDSAALGVLRIYSVDADGRFILAKPISETKTPFVPMRVQWAPDDRQLAVLALTIKRIPQRGQPTNVDVADVTIQVLDLATERWRAVGLVASDIRSIDIVGILNTMSWSR